MEKPIVLVMNELNKDVAELLNKYIPQLPANIILNSLLTVEPTLNNLAKQQLAKAKLEYEESEEQKDD